MGCPSVSISPTSGWLCRPGSASTAVSKDPRATGEGEANRQQHDARRLRD